MLLFIIFSGIIAEIRHSMMISETNEPTIGLCRSKSATALKSTDVSVGEEDLSALCQLLSISVALLESTNDNEYILALHLLDKVCTLILFILHG